MLHRLLPKSIIPLIFSTLLVGCIDNPFEQKDPETPINQPPIASFLKQETTLLATSTDSDSATLTHTWSVNNQVLSSDAQLDLTQQYFVNDEVLSGKHTLRLTTSDGELSSSIIIENISFTPDITVILNRAPTAIILADTLTANTTESITFDSTGSNDTEDGTNLTYQWFIDDVLIAAETNSTLEHTFVSANTYSVSLIVTDTENLASDLVSTDVIITEVISNSAPIAVITSDLSEALINEVVTFDSAGSNDTEDGTTLTYQWFIDDVLVLNETNSTFEYSFETAETYSVSLVVTDTENLDSDSVSMDAVISDVVFNSAPIAVITSDLSEALINEVVTFDSAGSNDIEDGTTLTYQWFINDVLVLNETNSTFEYSFDTAETYSVSLIVTDTENLASDLVSTDVIITEVISNSAPIAVITSDLSEALINEVVTFDSAGSNDTEDGTTLTYQWFIDDVLVLNETNSTFEYSFETAETYSVSLIVTDTENLASDLVSTDVIITEVISNSAPIAVITSDLSEALINEVVTFDSAGSNDTEDGTTLTYQWFIDDVLVLNETNSTFEYSFETAETYSVSLVVTDTENLDSDSVSMDVVISDVVFNSAPIAVITSDLSEALINEVVTFDSAGSNDTEDGTTLTYQWFIDDVLVLNETNSTFEYSFETAETYKVSLVVTDTENLDSDSVSMDVVISDVVFNSAPIAVITSDLSEALINEVVTFDSAGSNDTEDGTTLTYQWFIDDVLVLDESNSTLEYSFDTAETYSVSLVVTDTENLSSDAVYTDVTISESMLPVAMFTAQTADLLITVDAALSAGDNLTYAWDFNSESTGSGRTSFYQFTTEGEKVITLVISNLQGQSDSYSQTITISESEVNPAIIFEENFEQYDDDSQPAGWSIFADYQKNPYIGNYNTKINVISTDSNSGEKSLRIIGPENGPMQIFKALPASANKIYTRVYVKQTLQMGGLANTNHDHIIALRSDDPNPANKEVRWGEAKGAIGTTLVNNNPNIDDGAPDPQSENFGEHIVNADQWYCLEVGFDDTQEVSKLYSWADGVLVHSIEQNSDFTNIKDSVDDHWMSDMFHEIVFGWHSFSQNQNTLYFDDIVVSTERIGCDDTLQRVILEPAFELSQNSMVVTADSTESAGTAAFTYLWDFNGEYTSMDAIPSYTFSTGGNKTITLTITSGSSSKSLEKTINVIDTLYIELLQRVSTNIVEQTCFECHESSQAKPLMFDSFAPEDVELALKNYIKDNDTQTLIDVPNGIDHGAMPADQITDANNEQDWSDLVLAIDATPTRGEQPENAYIFDNFENQEHNAIPAGWKTWVEYGVNSSLNNPGNSSFVLIDTTKAYSGTNSVRVKTSNSVIKPTFLVQDLPTDQDAFYSRAWMYLPAELGGGEYGASGNHVHFMAYSTALDGSNQEELRFGAAKDKVLSAFLPNSIDDSTTKIVPTTIIPANEWVCVEFAMIKDPVFDQAIAWVNGVQTFAAISPTDWEKTPAQYFSDHPELGNYITFGWRAFGDTKGVEDVWFDDIAVSDEYIGCN
ncbi:PKD domain-containing protein [Marinicellulosiphila megalodicopiae]|uniref:PKD domain-containing protein n=1 Tax=Marinicellulosiphila megalodicopiae TaxID=2724896 RepID=UPI003BAEC1F3